MKNQPPIFTDDMSLREVIATQAMHKLKVCNLPSADAVLRLPEVMRRTGLTQPAIFSAVLSGDFPQPMRLGATARGWSEQAVQAWLYTPPTRRVVQLSVVR